MRKMILTALLPFFLVQCATVTQGPMQRIRVGSKPSGVSVKLSECGVGGTETAKTPAIVFVNRRATRCTLTFTHPELGTRTVSLIRTGRALDPTPPPEGAVEAAGAAVEFGGAFVRAGAEIVANVPGEAGAVMALPLIIAGGVVVAGVVVGVPLWGVGRGIDSITGANYRQSRSIVLVDFNKPVRNVAGRYSFANVNGKELPANTWTTRKGKCQVSTNSGSLVLDENGRWSSVITEQEFCVKKTHAPVESAAHGVFSVEGDRILLESESGLAIGVLQSDQVQIAMRGTGTYEGQTAVYTLRLQQ